MKCSISWHRCQWVRLGQLLAVVGLVLLTSSGQVLESSGGWVACPPQIIVEAKRAGQVRRATALTGSWEVGWAWLRQRWWLAALRSEVLVGLVGLSQQWSWGWLGLLPWLAWLWQGLGLSYPALNRQGWYSWLGWSLNRASGLALVGLGGLWLGQQLGLSE